MVYPKMYAVRQTFSREQEQDVPGAVRRELQRVSAQVKLQPGATVAIAVGSRGIRNLAVIVRGVVDGLKQMKAMPFIFPAMGSHGGGTAEGQASVLHHYGITEKAMGCPIRAGMETVRIGQSGEGVPVFLDLYASKANHVVAINRIKSHTEFKGEIESGIMKMLLIGMGKHEGARTYHKAFADYGFDRIVESVAPVVLEKAKVLFGLAIVENAYNETTYVRALLPAEVTRVEKKLLVKAKELAPRLPFDDIDILIADAMGKNISGSGMDTNVIGRFYNMAAREPARPRIKRIYVRNLTAESLGNGCGIGLADFAHRAIIDKMDVPATNTNCLTAVNPEKARIPIVCESDREALDFCFGTIGLTAPEDARVVRIHNTLDLTELEISHTLKGLIHDRTDLEVTGGPVPLEFDAEGRLRHWCTGMTSTVAG